MSPLRVLVYTETYSVGGCDRFLADLATHLDPTPWSWPSRGTRTPTSTTTSPTGCRGSLGAIEVQVANMREPLLGKVALRLGISDRARDSEADRPWQATRRRAMRALPASATGGGGHRHRRSA